MTTQLNAATSQTDEALDHPGSQAPVEVSVVMPCLNEAETLAPCIEKAFKAFRELGVVGEVIIADNGSVDGSQAIAERLGARVVPIPSKGYGNALFGGITAARGRYVIMGDSDDSYDFASIRPFVEQLREGHDLVMGNRFRGGILPGAMPWKHQYFGNPVLSFIGRLFFGSPVGDFYCGLRGFSKRAFEQLDLQTTGMEFAIEMVIKSTLLRQDIVEVPTKLHPDGRSRPPHLRTWRDGWRTLRFLLLYSPRWLFFIPSAVLFCLGMLGCLWLWGGPREVFGVRFDIHTMLVSGFAAVIGYQLLSFGLFTKIFAVVEGLHPSTRLSRWRDLNLELGLALGVLLTALGGGLLGWAVWGWRSVHFGDLEAEVTMRQVIPAVVLLSLGVQTIFASFFLSVLTLRRRPR